MVRVASALFFAMTFSGIMLAQSSAPNPADAASPSSVDKQKLNAILDEARAKLDAYLPMLPNIICAEHGDSRQYHGDKLKKDVTFTAQVKMVHAPLPKQPDRVTEDMAIQSENGKSAGKKPKPLPINLKDVFTNQNRWILPVSDRCISYRLLPSAPATILIERWIHPLRPEFAAKCASNPDANMNERVEITLDAQTMQMTALERPLQPRKDLNKGWEIGFRYEYKQQNLGGRQVLLPASLHAETLNPKTKWRGVLDASYGDYHRYGSTATVLPAP